MIGTQVHIEQDRHRLQLADDDVAQDADERKDPFAVRAPARELTDGALVFFAQPLEDGLQAHAADANRMQRNEKRHAPSAESLEDRHFFPRRDGESDRLGVAVEEIDVARATGERARRGYSIANVLNAARRVARDDPAFDLVIESKGRNAIV